MTDVTDLLRAVDFAAAVDVALIALFLFGVIGWLRGSGARSGPRRFVVVALPLLLVYLLADAFHLVLVESLLRGLLLVLVVAMVVLFQSDLRRLLDRIAVWGFGRRAESPSSPTLDVLTESATRLAATRTGALIAIRGTEPWDSHVHGGIELDGLVTRPLLYSIFAPNTPGHDGAVLVEGDRVSRFGVHLPLSARAGEDEEDIGTRHAAALGLSEECDALVIVVSEERGTVSVAEDGELRQVKSAELAARLERFWRRHYARESSIGRRRRVRRRAENALAAVALAVAAWLLFVYGADTVRRTFQVPIALRNVPEGWLIEEDTLSTRIILSGTDQAFRLLEPGDLVVSLDLSNPRPGRNDLAIGADEVNLPAGVVFEDADPREIAVTARRQLSTELPVRVRLVGVLPDTLALAVEPATVTVLSPEDAGRPTAPVATDAVEAAAVLSGAVGTVALALPAGLRLGPEERGEVRLRLVRRGPAADSATPRSR